MCEDVEIDSVCGSNVQLFEFMARMWKSEIRPSDIFEIVEPDWPGGGKLGDVTRACGHCLRHGVSGSRIEVDKHVIMCSSHWAIAVIESVYLLPRCPVCRFAGNDFGRYRDKDGLEVEEDLILALWPVCCDEGGTSHDKFVLDDAGKREEGKLIPLDELIKFQPICIECRGNDAYERQRQASALRHKLEKSFGGVLDLFGQEDDEGCDLRSGLPTSDAVIKRNIHRIELMKRVSVLLDGIMKGVGEEVLSSGECEL